MVNPKSSAAVPTLGLGHDMYVCVYIYVYIFIYVYVYKYILYIH